MKAHRRKMSVQRESELDRMVYEKTYDEYIFQESYLTARIFAFMCAALHEKPHRFGKERLCRLIYDIGQQAISLDKFDGIEAEHMDRYLRSIGMDVLADELRGYEQILQEREESST